MEALIKGQLGEIGTACCNAILSIEDNCWPQMFPLHPFLAPLLKGFCNGVALASAPSLF
ncbi:conserved hypothetical protein [Ricinus communis]|uniref:Prolamin-like domain-containing protein n=1 Tax=Ricinus communis TaxID=3988 RepID=B9T249_RICCO|nr:conserved hypothetical protein [Ricinus communis]